MQQNQSESKPALLVDRNISKTVCNIILSFKGNSDWSNYKYYQRSNLISKQTNWKNLCNEHMTLQMKL